MDYKQLQAFVAMVERGNSFQAAAALYIPQAVLHERLDQLERELGCPLLRHNGAQQEVTPKGLELYEYAKQMLAVQESLYQKQGENRDDTRCD